MRFPPDPVPAFKSWQDDSEGGEAQLSPLAGRMVPLPPLPLEEEGEEDEKDEGQEASPSSSRSHPHLLARRFLDFGAHSAQRFLQQDLDATSPTKAQRCCFMGLSKATVFILKKKRLIMLILCGHLCVVTSDHGEHRLAPKRP